MSSRTAGKDTSSRRRTSAKKPSRRRTPKLYRELAPWFHLLTSPKDYRTEAAFFRRLLLESCDRRPETVLELGSGGGNNASHLKRHFRMTLVDLSPQMLDLSRTINPECEHVVGDMRRVRLGRLFDAVFVHDAVVHMTTEQDLRRAMQTAFVHCRPGGAAVFSPDHVRENFREYTGHGGHDDGARGLRYVQWTWDPDPTDTTYYTDFAYLLRQADGSVRVAHDRHVGGLFRRRDWLRLLRDVGFEPTVLRFEPGLTEIGTEDVFVGQRPR